MEALFGGLPIERLRSMVETTKMRLKSRTGFIINRLQQLQNQGVPFESAMSNPEIIKLLNELQGLRGALHSIEQTLKRSGSGLRGGGLWEQIQHNSRILDATATRLNKLRQRRVVLEAQAAKLEQKLGQQGLPFDLDNPKVTKIVNAVQSLDNRINGLRAKLAQLGNLIEQLHVQMEQQVPDEDSVEDEDEEDDGDDENDEPLQFIGVG